MIKESVKKKRSLQQRRTRLRILKAGIQVLYGSLIINAILGRSFIVAALLLAVALLSGAWFCGWLCPFGAVQEWLGRLGKLIFGKRLKIPGKIEKYLRFLRYILLIAGFTGLGILAFLNTPYQTFLGAITLKTAYVSLPAWILLGLFLAASLIIDRPFCRYFCTEGARYGALSLGRIFSIKRDSASCISCGACDKACVTQVKISTKNHVRHMQCINCLECLTACPVQGCLSYGFTFKKRTKEIEYETAEKKQKTSA